MNESNKQATETRRNLWKAIGPGILVACAAIGGLILALTSWLGIAFFVAMSAGFIYVQFLRG